MTARRQRLWTLASLLPFAAICFSHLDYIPIWDSYEYADCIAEAARSGSFPADYGCAQHPTLAWVAISALLEQFFHGRYWPILLMSCALGLFALYQFLQLFFELFASPGERLRDGFLLTACLGIAPLFLASAISVNPDFAITAFLLALIRSLLRARFREAALYALLLTFCKEPGILVVAICICAYAFLYILRGENDDKNKLRALARLLPALAGAPLLFAWMKFGPHNGHQLLWHGSSLFDLAAMMTSFSLFDRLFLAQLVCIFILQFLWLPTLAALSRWLPDLWRAAIRVPSQNFPALRFVELVFLLSLYVLTRPQTFLNPRYFLPLMPLLLLCAYPAIRRWRPLLRTLAIGIVALCFLTSAFRTIDPISRRIFGTFPFGQHPLLSMTSLTHEIAGEGRDQLAYNLEHIELNDLQNEIYRSISPGIHRALATDKAANWWLVENLDLTNNQRTLDHENSWRPHLYTADELGADGAPELKPATIYWLRFPNIHDTGEERAIDPWYQRVRELKFERHGYELTATEYRLRAK